MFLIAVVGNKNIMKINYTIFHIAEYKIRRSHYGCRCIAVNLLHDKSVIYAHMTAKGCVCDAFGVDPNIVGCMREIKFASEGSRPYNLNDLFYIWHR